MDKKLLTVTVLVLLLAVIIGGCVIKKNLDSSANKNNILMHVYIFKDPPESNYEIRKGTPNNVGVYEFYYKNPKLLGTGAFKKLDTISLNRINETVFYGEKSIRIINGTLCIGYPSTNFIDGKACVKVDQSQNETNITIHYWNTDIITI